MLALTRDRGVMLVLLTYAAAPLPDRPQSRTSFQFEALNEAMWTFSGEHQVQLVDVHDRFAAPCGKCSAGQLFRNRARQSPQPAWIRRDRRPGGRRLRLALAQPIDIADPHMRPACPPSSVARPRPAWRLGRARMSAGRLVTAGYAVLAVTLSVMVYAPILQNYFHTEDFQSLNTIANVPFWTWVLQSSAGHVLVGRNAFFSLMYALAGGYPAPWFGVLLLLHAVNVLIVFLIVRATTRSRPLGCLAAAAWGVAPVNEGALGWLQACGYVLASTPMLVALAGLVGSATRSARPSLSRAIGWSLVLLLGATTCGAGLAVGIFFPLAVVALLGLQRLSWPVRAVLVVLPVCLGATYLATSQRAFVDRAVLAGGLVPPAGMLLHLILFGLAMLVAGFADPVITSPTISTYLVAAMAATCLLAALLLGPARTRRLLIALCILALGGYGFIALGRAGLYAMVPTLPVYGAAIPRYHYEGACLFAIALAIALAAVGRRVCARARWHGVLLAWWLALAALLYRGSGWTIQHFSDERHGAERALARIRDALVHTPAGWPVVLLNEPFLPAGRYPFFAGDASFYTIYLQRRSPGREVYFVDRDAVAWYRFLPGSPLSAVVIPPPEGGLANIACLAQMPLGCAVNE